MAMEDQVFTLQVNHWFAFEHKSYVYWYFVSLSTQHSMGMLHQLSSPIHFLPFYR